MSSIYEQARKMIKKYKTSDPFQLADALKINVLFSEELGKLKGMFLHIEGNSYIFINSKLDEYKQRIVCAHELGHWQLHRTSSSMTIREYEIYDMRDSKEYEANIFAASLLLDDDEILEYIYGYRYDAQKIAAIMNSDINLVALKISDLNTRGYDFNKVDFRSDFLKQ